MFNHRDRTNYLLHQIEVSARLAPSAEAVAEKLGVNLYKSLVARFRWKTTRNANEAVAAVCTELNTRVALPVGTHKPSGEVVRVVRAKLADPTLVFIGNRMKLMTLADVFQCKALDLDQLAIGQVVVAG